MKKLSSFILALLLVFSLTVAAGAVVPQVNDYAGILTRQQWEELEQVYDSVRDEHGYSPYLLTTDSLAGMSAYEYADDFYYRYELDYDAILLMVCLDEGCWAIITNGICYDRLSQSQTDAMGEAVARELRSGNYYDAFLRFAAMTTDSMEAAPSRESDWDEDDDFDSSFSLSVGSCILLCLAGGLVVGLIVVLIMVSGMKKIKSNPSANDYMVPGSMNLTHSRDIYLYSTVTRIKKPDPPKSISGGGRSHGGSSGRI